jgi:ABC-type antimicrobial peptide transport system permease subunit
MKIPFAYTWRSLWTRRLTTVLTLTGIALVAFVFASVLMLSRGVENTLIETGSEDNAIVLRKSATSELVSQINRDHANLIKTFPEVGLLPDGKPFVSTETYVIINLLKRGSNDMGNISVRGISPEGLQLRPQVRLSAGRWFTFGSQEIVIGKNISSQFNGTAIGNQLRFGDAQWTIVGEIDGQGTAFDSEIWGDSEQMMPAFGRPVFSTVTFRLKSREMFDAVKLRIEQDPRTSYTEVKREQTFYREQSEMMSNFIRILGLVVTIIFSVGAMIGAMITMYAAVANRTREIGTMRALGFQRRSILGAFLVESVLLSLIGGAIGIVLASAMSFVRISTTNFGSFSELAFGFSLAPDIIGWTLFFSVIMGIVGGVLPSIRASRLNILTALRSA